MECVSLPKSQVGAGVTLQCFLFNGCHDVADFCKLPQAICEGRHAIVAP